MNILYIEVHIYSPITTVYEINESISQKRVHKFIIENALAVGTAPEGPNPQYSMTKWRLFPSW